jgi:hypothetical protein
MRRLVGLFGFILFLAVSAGAQGPEGAGSNPGQDSRPIPHSFSFEESPTWQMSLTYQFNRINMTGTPFITNGFSVGVTRYFTRWFGVDGQWGFGFGNPGTAVVPTCPSAKSIFAGGGPRVTFRNHSRLEPWVHFVGGMQHFKFAQTGGPLGNNTSLAGMGGGGVDYPFSSHLAIRAEADEIFTHYLSTNQRHIQVVTGLVFNF